MIRRSIENAIQQAMADTPVVLLNGARQTGKTTLAQALTEKESHTVWRLRRDRRG